MPAALDPLTRRISRAMAFPPGTGGLISAATRRRFVLSFLGSVGLSAMDMLGVAAMVPMMQYVSGQDTRTGAIGWVNQVLGYPDGRTLVVTLSAVIVAAFVVKDICAIIFRRWQLHFMAADEVRLSTRLLEGYLVGPWAWHLSRNTADKVWTVEYAVGIGYAGSLGAALGAATEVVTLVLIIVTLLIVSPLATVGAVIYFAIAGFAIQRVMGGRSAAAGRSNLAASQASSRSSLQAFGAAKEIKLRHAQDRFVAEYERARLAGAHARATTLLLTEVPKYLLEIVFVVGIGLLAAALAAAGTAQSSLVTLGVFVAAGTRVLPSVVRLMSTSASLRFGRAPLELLIGVDREQEGARQDQADAVRTDRVPAGDIEVRAVRFAYPDQPGTAVLDGLDLTVPVGTSVALVGSSGAGKSTLVDVLLGLHHPGSGEVTAGGVDVFANLPAWQRRLAVVPQDVFLLDDTLRANIAFDEEPDRERLAVAVERAQLSELVAGLPDGLDAMVGERGARLSGGQRQRIGIARALYRDPAVLFLDEATAALDNETEHRLTSTIESLGGSMTMVIVAHRLSTVRHCDQLVFMSAGRVVTAGTYEQVLAGNAEFARLVALGSLEVDAID